MQHFICGRVFELDSLCWILVNAERQKLEIIEGLLL